jgi:hypothetical protein
MSFQKRFALRSVIATNLDIANFVGSLFAACRFAALRSQFFYPALFPPKAEWPKATY